MSDDLNQAIGSDRASRTRRNVIGAAATALVSALLIGVLWLLSRASPSAGRDPAWPLSN